MTDRKYGVRVEIDTEISEDREEFEWNYVVEKVEIDGGEVEQVLGKNRHDTIEGVVKQLSTLTDLEVE